MYNIFDTDFFLMVGKRSFSIWAVGPFCNLTCDGFFFYLAVLFSKKNFECLVEEISNWHKGNDELFL